MTEIDLDALEALANNSDPSVRIDKVIIRALIAAARERDALKTAAKVVVKAVEPFTKYPNYCDTMQWPDGASVKALNGNSLLLDILMSDLRRAREALALITTAIGARP